MKLKPWNLRGRLRLSIVPILGVAVLAGSSCSSHTETGALVGAGGGAALGAVVDDDKPGRGAVIGGAAGAVAGAMIGKQKDEREREYRHHYYR